MFLSGGTPMFGTPQENANRAWQRLGEKVGFD
jgi:aromatic ring-opening dioxygenase catalytic subunit (LigB family)